MKIKEEYENGLLNGTRLVYYQKGEKQVDETYQFGMVTGLVKNYYEDGKPLSESYYRLPNGTDVACDVETIAEG